MNKDTVAVRIDLPAQAHANLKVKARKDGKGFRKWLVSQLVRMAK